MKLQHVLILLLIPVSLISCKNKKTNTLTDAAATHTETIDTTKTTKNTQNSLSDVELKKTIVGLQGEWKEPEYPFRRAIFKNATVKLIEEGVVEQPHFQEFQLTHSCPSTSVTNDVYILIQERDTCEKITLSDDTLTLNGVTSDYTIVYKRIKK